MYTDYQKWRTATVLVMLAECVCVSSFTTPTAFFPSPNEIMRQQGTNDLNGGRGNCYSNSNTVRLSLFPDWRKKKQSNEEDPVRPISFEDEEKDDKPPTDVYASRMTSNQDEDTSNDNNNNDDDVIDIQIDSSPTFPQFDEETDYDVVIVGGGCSGVGTSLMLTNIFGLDKSRVLCLEQGKEVGTSFREWPEEMRFISPSFNQQGWTDSFDLNSIYWGTSPAAFLREEHPSGEDYALYLEAMAKQSGIQMQLETKVASITDMRNNGDGKREKKNGGDENDVVVPGPFNVEIEKKISENGDEIKRETISARFIVWAAGEFQHPRDKRTISYEYKDGDENSGKSPTIKFEGMFPGAELCLHNSRVKSWSNLPGDDFVVIGGYESGVDAAYHLASAGKKCHVLASTPTWCLQTGDPSSELAPYTAARLREVLSPRFSPQPKMLAPLRVIAVDKAKGGGYNIAAKWKAVDEENQNTVGLGFQIDEPGEEDSIRVLHTDHPPILCTGFEGSVAAQASHLFDFPDPNNKKGCIGDGPLLTREDESTKVPGVFLVGPSVTHGELSFCFVYKFRQRFAVVAKSICEYLGMDTRDAVAECRNVNMFLDDFATCDDTCGDVC